MGFRENLKDELKYQNVLVKELSDKTNISKRTLDNYLRENASSPTIENAVKIASALGVTVEYLVTGRTNQESKTISDEVLKLTKEISHLPEQDFLLIKSIVQRIK